MVYFYDKLYVIIVNSCLIIYPVVLRERFGAIGIHFPHSVAAKELYITIRVIRSFPTTWKIIPSKQWDFHGLLWTFHMILTSQNGQNRGFHDLAIKKKSETMVDACWGGLGWMGIHHLKSRREPSKFQMVNHFQWCLSPLLFLMAIYIYTHINAINCVILYYHYDDH